SFARCTATPARCFNPHPARRPGATVSLRVVRQLLPVSIPTRPADRVRQTARRPARAPSLVSIPTRPADRVRQPRSLPTGDPRRFQSPPGPQTGCDVAGLDALPGLLEVSIPTRPADRVRRVLRGQVRRLVAVSIPTRPA